MKKFLFTIVMLGCTAFSYGTEKSVTSEEEQLKLNQQLFQTFRQSGDMVEMKRLIDMGADVNYTEHYLNMITLAVWSNDICMTEFLIAEGTELVNGEGENNLLDYAPSNAMAEILYNHGVNDLNSALFSQAKNILLGKHNIHKNSVEFLLEHGVSPDTTWRNAWSAISIALLSTTNDNAYEIIKLLLQYSADVSPDTNMATPLHYASYNDNPQTINLLIDQGLDVNAQDKNGNTPLHCAKSFLKENPQVIKVLLEHGADPNIRNKDGKLYSEITWENSTSL
ncbi:MAG: ankyrin repeat domain-containing protein [Victivallaceae bacterium]